MPYAIDHYATRAKVGIHSCPGGYLVDYMLYYNTMKSNLFMA